jgi:DNA-3-methyladenine glycosylase I
MSGIPERRGTARSRTGPASGGLAHAAADRSPHPPVVRCPWCGSDPLYRAYHDEQWGVPLADERRLFEMLVLEGAQAGLSWLIILRKREGYRRAFDGFDPEKVARYDTRRIGRLLADPGIVRNRLKLESAVRNARGVLAVRETHGSLARFLWDFVGGKPRQNRWGSLAEVPARTAESDAMSRALRRLGFGFVGPTVCYAFMQAVGMANDHTTDCFRHAEVAKLGRAWRLGD